MAYVYIMTNPAYEGYVKIGSTKNSVEQRRQELSAPPGVMFPFEIYAYYETEKQLMDKSIHKLIDTINPELRANKRREFYKMTNETAYKVLESIAECTGAQGKLIKCVDDGIGEKAKKKPRFSFKSAGIKPGEEIEFIGEEKQKAIVKDDRHIIYNNKTMSVSDLAQKLLNSKWQVQGTLYFTYKGETLNDRRLRMERENKYK